MLAAYRTATQGLLQNPGAPSTLFSTTDIDRWINVARGQIAGESEGIRQIGTISTVIDQRPYAFSAINLGVSATTGIQGVINVRNILYGVGDGLQVIQPRGWEWFLNYHLNNPVPVAAPPEVWSQFKQGAAGGVTPSGTLTASGSFYLDPPPDLVYNLQLDCVCYPNVMDDDADVEALPYLWTDAVPFLAAYYALMSSQVSQRIGDAARMWQMYLEFSGRARQFSNPSVNRPIYAQSPDPTVMNKLGMQNPQRAQVAQGS